MATRYRLVSRAHQGAAGDVILPPHGITVRFDAQGISDTVDTATKENACLIPGFALHECVEVEDAPEADPDTDAVSLEQQLAVTRARCNRLIDIVDDIAILVRWDGQGTLRDAVAVVVETAQKARQAAQPATFPAEGAAPPAADADAPVPPDSGVSAQENATAQESATDAASVASEDEELAISADADPVADGDPSAEGRNVDGAPTTANRRKRH